MKGQFFLLIIFLFLVGACQKSEFVRDVNHLERDVEIKRLDSALFLEPQLPVDTLLARFNPFFELYSFHILRMGNPSDSLFPLYLTKFTGDATMKEVKQKVDEHFDDLSIYRNQLEQLFSYMAFYDSLFEIPFVYTCISGFNQSVVTDSLLIGISLDKYLGTKCLFYDYLEIPVYLRKRMVPERIVVDVAEAYGRMNYAKEMQMADLLAAMVYEGKLQYFQRAMLPYLPDTLLLNYSNAELNWLRENENAIWTFLIENKKLFETSAIEIRKFTGDAPFTAAFGNNSPGRAGTFIGRQIVFLYMQKNPHVSLMELMAETDAQMILQKAAYNP
jgi:hypothetical protein